MLVLEPAADGGALKIGRKGVGMYDVEVGGRAAHAGLEPEKGVNALVEAAHQVLAITAIARPERGHDGDADGRPRRNGGERRPGGGDDPRRRAGHVARRGASGSTRRWPRWRRSIRRRRSPSPAASTARRCRSESSAELFAAAQQAAAAVGIGPVEGVSVGGGSDGNFTAALGIPTLDGLGVVGGGAHADHEWVDVASLPERAALLAALITSLTELGSACQT